MSDKSVADVYFKDNLGGRWIVLEYEDGEKRFTGRLINNAYVKDIKGELYNIEGKGYPISNRILHFLKKVKIDKIVLNEHRKDGLRRYVSSVQKFLDAPIVQQGGFEQQNALPLKSLERVM